VLLPGNTPPSFFKTIDTRPMLPSVLCGGLLLATLPSLAPKGDQPATLPNFTPTQTRPLLDAPGDGSAWALGETYKLGLSPAGARFAPLLGQQVQRPQWLRLAAPELWIDQQRLAQPSGEVELSGQRLSIRRGWFEERFDCSAKEVEHSFLIESRAGLPTQGDLTLRLPTSGDLLPAGRNQGQRFLVPGASGDPLATVTYGDWLARDATGREIRGETGFEAGALTITVPESFWTQAAFPLLVDPVLSVFSVDSNSFANETDSDVSYDLSNDVWLVVYTDSGNGNDDDVLARRYTGDGVFLEEVAVDIDGEDESTPRVANNNKHNSFLVTWAREQDSFNTDRIQARRRTAGSTGQGSIFNVSSASNERSPDVGGTSDLVSDAWFVVWEETNAISSTRRIVGTLVDQSSNLGTSVDVTFFPGLFPGDAPPPLSPRVTSTAGPFNHWVVVWQPESIFGGFNDLQVRAVSNPSLNLSTELTLGLPGGNNVEPRPTIAGDGRNFLLVYAGAQSNNDLFARRLLLSGDLVEITGSLTPLSPLLEGQNQFLPQDQPWVSGDGCRFTLAYRQGGIGLGNFDIRCTSFVVADNGQYLVTDPPVSLQVSNEDDRLPSVASKYDGGGSSLESFGTWTRVPTATNLNLNGFRFETADQGGVQVLPTGCGAAFLKPDLSLLGNPQLASNLTLNLNTGLGGGAPLILIGEPTNLPLCPGQASCALGVGVTYLSVPAASTQLVIPSKLGFLGAQFAMQGATLGVASGIGCGAPLYPIAFRVSDTLLVTIG
jgi:hypothetical protein